MTLSVPQRFLDAIRSAWGGGELKVEISPSPNTPAITQGALVFIDNTVNQQSGTIAVKARVKNEKEELWPGQFVAARIVLKVEEGALVLPEAAVLPGQDGPFVYVIKDGRAQVQNIVVDRQINDQIVISKGVTEGMEVVKDAPPTLAAGSQVVLGGSEGKSGKGAGKGGKGKGKDGKQAEPDAAAKDVSGKKVKP